MSVELARALEAGALANAWLASRRTGTGMSEPTGA
jgi:hypothetical protein